MEILAESPKHDIQTQSERVLLEKQCRQTRSKQGCHKPSICKDHKCQQSTTEQGVPVNIVIILLCMIKLINEGNLKTGA